MLKPAIMLFAVALISTHAAFAEETASEQERRYAEGNYGDCAPHFPLSRISPQDRASLEIATQQCMQKKSDDRSAATTRAREEAAQQATRKAASTRAANAHDRYLKEHNLTPVTVVDLQANGKNMTGGHIVVQGYVRIFSEEKIAIYTSANDVNGVRLDISDASPQTRRNIFGWCSDLHDPCQMEIAGTVAFDNHVLVQVE